MLNLNFLKLIKTGFKDKLGNDVSYWDWMIYGKGSVSENPISVETFLDRDDVKKELENFDPSLLKTESSKEN